MRSVLIRRRAAPVVAVAVVSLAMATLVAGCTGDGSPRASSTSKSAHGSTATSRQAPAPSVGVAAVREPLTTDPSSPVAHDTEVMALAAHAGRVFAATDQWEYPGPDGAGQVLVKDSS